jgi:hypothetical protein
MPTRIFTGNTAYEYSSWACHTSATMEFFCLPLLTFKEQVHEERVDVVDLWFNINQHPDHASAHQAKTQSFYNINNVDY